MAEKGRRGKDMRSPADPGTFSPLGFDLLGKPRQHQGVSILYQRYLIPPFSVWNGDSPMWKTRRKAWLATGIKPDLGRDDQVYDGMQRFGYKGTNTSVFDPVTCEVCYRWFCPKGGMIIDPFAGASVRGVMASLMKRAYWGSDIRPKQVAANRVQLAEVCPDEEDVTWVCGNSVTTTRKAPKADFVFTSPPYGDIYSDLPDDLSTMNYTGYKGAYWQIIKNCCNRLKENRFACFVVGNFRNKRDKRMPLCALVADTITAFQECGLDLYNDIVYLNPIPTLGLRSESWFKNICRVGMAHQNILVFVKGDPKVASKVIITGEEG